MRDERDIDRAVRRRKKKTSKRFRSRCKTTTGIKAPLLIPVGASNRDKRVTLLAGLVLPIGIKGLDLLSRVEPPTGTKGSCPPLARLAVGSGTKATFCPGPKGSRDKWPGTKACSVVVYIFKKIGTNFTFF